VIERSSDLVLSVVDSSKSGGEPLAVSASLSVSDYDGKTVDKWFPLHKAPKSKHAAGEIHLRIHVGKPDEKPLPAPPPKAADVKSKIDSSSGNHAPVSITASAPPAVGTALGPGFGTGFGVAGAGSVGGPGFTGTGSMRPSPAASAPAVVAAKSGGGNLTGSTSGSGAPVKEETKDIFYFIRENDFTGLSNFLKNPAFEGINTVDSYGYTPLQSACSSKEIDDRIIMRLLQVTPHPHIPILFQSVLLYLMLSATLSLFRSIFLYSSVLF
jgi:hypothetical protein